MTFTYSTTDLTTSLAKVRRLIADTDSTNALFTDEEINFFLAESSGIYAAAALANRAIAGSKTLVARRLQIGDLSEDYGQIVSDLLAQAAAWERRGWSAGTRHPTRVDGYSDDVASDEV